jgi:HSP20 family protein
MRELVDRLGASFDQPGLLRGHTTMPDFPVEVSETASDIEIKASLPGVEPHDIDITVQANSLSIKAESREEAEDKGKNYLRREMSYGAMQRSFALPASVNPDKAEATFQNGVLRLKLPKAAPVGTKQIRVT